MRIDLNEVMDAELNSSSLAKKFKIYFNKLVVSCRCYGLCSPCEAQRLTLCFIEEENICLGVSFKLSVDDFKALKQRGL